MIVQCEACQTRFRLADEKIKPGGTKVRCSKCKEIFTVMPPEPEPVEESVDFDSFNMEAVNDETGSDETPAEESRPTADETPEASDSAAPETEGDSGEIDFSSLESEMGDSADSDELADDFSFADTSQPAEEETASEPQEEDTTDFGAAFEETAEPTASEQESGFDFDEGPSDEPATEDTTDFGAAFEESEEPGGPMEFDFSADEESGIEATGETAASDDEPSGPSEFDFSSDDAEAPAASDAFSFDSEPEQEEAGEPSFGDDDAFDFDDNESETIASDEEATGPSEFSFDEENPFAEDSASEWGDEAPAGDTFDFDEPQFESPPSEPAGGEEEGLQFGEIDFADDGVGEESQSVGTDDDFANATMATQSEPESFTRSEPPPRPARDDHDDVEPLPVPPPPKKSSLSRVLVLLVLLLLVLGGAAGFLFLQGGALNLNTVTEYLPFLKEYIGEPQQVAPGDRIGINISGSSYVNGQAGQMLVIQGEAVNNHPSSRSSITIKGLLLDAQGKTLLQQTVFCGNALNESQLSTMPFKAIEEAMNNEFGDSLSNMNIASGASIPFTIVFRNLPAGIANINVEVVDSKPGAG